MLKINNLTKRFGGLAAVNNVSIEFEANKINAIIEGEAPSQGAEVNLVFEHSQTRLYVDGWIATQAQEAAA